VPSTAASVRAGSSARVEDSNRAEVGKPDNYRGASIAWIEDDRIAGSEQNDGRDSDAIDFHLYDVASA
jgi:hypothetical protein